MELAQVEIGLAGSVLGFAGLVIELLECLHEIAGVLLAGEVPALEGVEEIVDSWTGAQSTRFPVCEMVAGATTCVYYTYRPAISKD